MPDSCAKCQLGTHPAAAAKPSLAPTDPKENADGQETGATAREFWGSSLIAPRVHLLLTSLQGTSGGGVWATGMVLRPIVTRNLQNSLFRFVLTGGQWQSPRTWDDRWAHLRLV